MSDDVLTSGALAYCERLADRAAARSSFTPHERECHVAIALLLAVLVSLYWEP